MIEIKMWHPKPDRIYPSSVVTKTIIYKPLDKKGWDEIIESLNKSGKTKRWKQIETGEWVVDIKTVDHDIKVKYI